MFNEFVNPENEMEWCKHAMNVHGLHRSHPSIMAADNMSVVWGKFEVWIDSNITHDEEVILVAYNGEKCDLKWIW